MPLIKVDKFSGLAPKFNDEALPDSAATVSEYCNYNSGTVTGLRADWIWSYGVALRNNNTAIRSGFVWDGLVGTTKQSTVYSLDEDANFVKSPTQNDAHRRLYWTSETGGFRFTKVPPNANMQCVLPPIPKEVLPFTNHAQEVAIDNLVALDLQAGFKVGCINSAKWPKRLMSDLGVTCSIVDAGVSVPMDTLDMQGGGTFAISGSNIVKANVVVNQGLGTAVNGWYPAYFTRLDKPLRDYFSFTTGNDVYSPTAVRVKVGDSSSENAVAWRDKHGAIWYLVLSAGGYASGAEAGDTVSVVELSVTTTDVWVGDNLTISSYETPVATHQMVYSNLATQDYNHLVMLGKGTQIPSEILSSSAAVTVTPMEPTIRGDLTITYDGELHSLSLYEDAALNKPVKLGDSVTIHAKTERVTAVNKEALETEFGQPFVVGTDFIMRINSGVSLPPEERVYVMTFVNGLGEESFPSEPITVSLDPGLKVAQFTIGVAQWVTAYKDTAIGRYHLHGMRFYRSATSSTGDTEYLYAFTVKIEGESNLAGDVYPNVVQSTTGLLTWKVNDTVSAAALGSACTTQDLVDSDDLQKLRGLTAIHHGMIAGFTGNTIYISEPYLPYCFRTGGVHTLPHKVVSLVPMEQGFYALTSIGPYYVSGNLPEQMMTQRVPGDYPCISKNAAVCVGSGVLYLSTDGPVSLSGMNAQIDTSTWSRETWRDDFMKNIIANDPVSLAVYGHRLLAYQPGKAGCYIFDIDDGNWSHIDDTINYAFQVPAGTFGVSDSLAISGTATGSSARWTLFAIEKNTRSCIHRTKTFKFPRPVSMAALQLFAVVNKESAAYDDYADSKWASGIAGQVDITVYADEVQVGSPITLHLRDTVKGTVPANPYGMAIARLPAGFMAAKWSFKLHIAKNTTVLGLHVASSMKELQND